MAFDYMVQYSQDSTNDNVSFVSRLVLERVLMAAGKKSLQLLPFYFVPVFCLFFVSAMVV